MDAGPAEGDKLPTSSAPASAVPTEALPTEAVPSAAPPPPSPEAPPPEPEAEAPPPPTPSPPPPPPPDQTDLTSLVPPPPSPPPDQIQEATPPPPPPPQRAAARPAPRRSSASTPTATAARAPSPGPNAANQAGAAEGPDSSVRVEGAELGPDWIRQLQAWWDRHAFFPGEAVVKNVSGTVKVHLVVKPDGVVSNDPRVAERGVENYRQCGLPGVPRCASAPVPAGHAGAAGRGHHNAALCAAAGAGGLGGAQTPVHRNERTGAGGCRCDDGAEELHRRSGAGQRWRTQFLARTAAMGPGDFLPHP